MLLQSDTKQIPAKPRETNWFRDPDRPIAATSSRDAHQLGVKVGNQALPAVQTTGSLAASTPYAGMFEHTAEAEAEAYEAEKFQTLAGASDSRHDVAMSAIRNMK